MSRLAPRPGLALVRPVQTAESLPGGKIILTENVRRYTAMAQVELVAIGSEAEADDYQWGEDEDSRWDELQRLQPGAWLLLGSRSQIETTDPDLFLIRHEDIVAVLAES